MCIRVATLSIRRKFTAQLAEIDSKIKQDEAFVENFEVKGRLLKIHPQSLTIYIDESVNVSVAEGLRRRGVTAFSSKDLENWGIERYYRWQKLFWKLAQLMRNGCYFAKPEILLKLK